MKTYKYLQLAILVFIILMVSCNEKEACPDTQVPYLRLAMANASTEKLDSLFVYSNLLSDSIFGNTYVPDLLRIPLKLDSDTTIFNLGILYNTATKKNDTVLFEYNTVLKINRIECGFTTEFVLKMVTSTTNFIDSISISDPIINSESNTHVKIYF